MSLKQLPAKNSASPFASMKGHHVAVRVPDFAAAKRWYVDKLDFRIVAEWDYADEKLAYLAPATDDRFYVEVLGGGEHVAGPQGEPGEVARDGRRLRALDRAARHEPLLGGLLADAHAGADLAPRQAGPAGLVDEVADQRVGLLVHLGGDSERVRHVLERPAIGVQGLHVGDEVVQRDGKLCHASTLR